MFWVGQLLGQSPVLSTLGYRSKLMSPLMDGITRHLTASCPLIVPPNAPSLSTTLVFTKKSLNPCQESAKAIFLPTVEPLKVSSEYCHLSSFSTQNLQLSQRSEYCPILRRFCKTGCSLSMTCIPPLSPLSPPPSQIGAKCHISTHQTCHTMCHVKDATLADNIYFAGAGSQNAC